MHWPDVDGTPILFTIPLDVNNEALAAHALDDTVGVNHPVLALSASRLFPRYDESSTLNTHRLVVIAFDVKNHLRAVG